MASITTGNINCMPRVAKTGSYTVTTTDLIIGCDTTGGAFTITLPAANTFQNGQYLYVKDEGGNVDTNNITIIADGDETIDGDTEIIVTSNYTSITIYSNGVDKWFIC